MRTGLVATNLFTNPSCETAVGNGTIRTNLAISPNMEDLTTYSVFSVTKEQSSEWADQGTYSLKLVSTGVTTDCFASVGGDTGGFRSGLQAGKTYTISAVINTPVAQVGPLHGANARKIALFYKDADTVYKSALSNQGPVTGSARVSVTFAIPAGATEAFIRLYNGSSGTGDTVYWDSLLVEEMPVLLDYFDGNTPAVGDFSYVWLGTPNASTSIQRAPGVANITTGNSWGIQSSEWYQSGSKSLRIIPTNAFNSSSAILGVTLTAGKTYTCIATRRLPAPLTGTLSSYAGAIISVQVGVGTFLSPAPIPNVAGIAEARLTFYLDPANTANTLRVGHGGSAGSGDVWWDNIIIVEGNYTGPYFSGNTPEGVTVIHRWTGTPNASTSEQYSIANAEGYNPSKALADARLATMETVLGPNPVRTLNGSFADVRKAALEKVLSDNGLI